MSADAFAPKPFPHWKITRWFCRAYDADAVDAPIRLGKTANNRVAVHPAQQPWQARRAQFQAWDRSGQVLNR